MNPNIEVVAYQEHVRPDTIFDILDDKSYTHVLDCTDNPVTRYLVNDACVVRGLPLVSASALKTEGQLSVLDFQSGPCYRCLFPTPPPPNSVVACGDGGILGPVVGIMGVYQAIETIKVITGYPSYQPSLILFSAYSFPMWRSMKMRSKKSNCQVCGDAPVISEEKIKSGEINYVEFCGRPDMVFADDATERVDVKKYKSVREGNIPHTLLDVRTKEQFEICRLPESLNVTYAQLQKLKDLPNLKEPIYVVCRYGNDSQGSVKELKRLGYSQVWDIKGGLNQWTSEIDPTFPIY